MSLQIQERNKSSCSTFPIYSLRKTKNHVIIFDVLLCQSDQDALLFHQPLVLDLALGRLDAHVTAKLSEEFICLGHGVRPDGSTRHGTFNLQDVLVRCRILREEGYQ